MTGFLLGFGFGVTVGIVVGVGETGIIEICGIEGNGVTKTGTVVGVVGGVRGIGTN